MQDPMLQSENADEVLSKSIHGGKWLIIGQLTQKGIGFVSFFILARLLTPKDFGIMAIILMIPKFAESVTDTGLATALIQKKEEVIPYLNPIWTIHIVKSLLIFAGTLIGGPLIARFLHAEEVTNFIRLGGLFMVVYNLSNIGETYFFKDLDFKKVFLRNIVKEAVYVVTALVLAIFWRSYMVLFIATFASYATQTISTYILHPYRPRISLRFDRLKELVGYSKWIVGQGWITQLYGLMENMTVARLTNVSTVGLYSKAKNLASVAPGVISPMISMVSFSAYSKIQDEMDKIKAGFLKSLDVFFFFLIPITIFVIIGGHTLVLTLLGEQWLPIINTLRILALFFLFGSINDFIQSLFNAIGHPKRQTTFQIFKMLITFALIIPLTIKYSMLGTAIALFIGAFIPLLFNIYYLGSLTRIHVRDIISSAALPIAISLCILVAPAAGLYPWVASVHPLVFFSLSALAGCIYIVTTYLIGRVYHTGPYATLRLILQHVWK